MEILRTITLYVEGKELPFLIIGGHAVNAYGISRQTGDIDLLVQRSKRPQWLELLEKLDYLKDQDDERFARFRGKTIAAWPIALMFVDDQTFSKLADAAIECNFGACRCKVVSPNHLVTLKLHALKYFQEDRFNKDYTDLISLLRSGRAKLTREEIKELCSRYATAALYDRIDADLSSK